MKAMYLAIVSLGVFVTPNAFGQFGPRTFTHDLNADNVPERITVSGSSVEITSPTSKIVRKYSVGAWNYVQFANLDSRPGDEVLVTNLQTINGVSMPARATVISYLINLAKPYSVDRPNYMQIRDLDGLPGQEVVFTNLWTLQGVPEPAQARIISSRNRTLTSYDVGRPNYMQFAELDGAPGEEMLFTSLRTINTFPQPAQATVLDFRLKTVQTFSVGAASSFKLVPRHGKAGNDIVFLRTTGAPITIFFNGATHTFAKK
jgi:hypothetical protein